MTYKDTLDYLYARLPMFQRVGPMAFKKDLTNIKAILEALGNPERYFKSIHVGGTNGKGSVSHVIAGCLTKMGYKTGLYTSPHYKDIKERIKIDGQFIDEDFFTDFINDNKALIEAINPSYFELLVAMSFSYFKHEKVDFAIVEVGLGGRLDSTNVIEPLLSVITNIGYDHQAFLGDTLVQIAGEKAGIIKRSTPVLIGERQREVEDVFIKKADNEYATLKFAEDYTRIEWEDNLDKSKGIKVIHDGNIEINASPTDLMANYQLKNLSTAYSALRWLGDIADIKFTPEVFEKTIASLRKDYNFLGRFDVIQHSPFIVLDSAHNVNGMEALLKEIDSIPYDDLHVVFGTVTDKNINPVLELLPTKGHYYFCKPDIPRGMDADQLLEMARAHSLKGISYGSAADAYNAAIRNAGTNDLICACGSIFVVAEVI